MFGSATRASSASPASLPSRFYTDTGIRDSVSKPLKKLKHQLTESIRKRKEGSRNDSRREGGETDVGESEAGQSSRLNPQTEDMAKSGAGRKENDEEGNKVVQVNPPASTPSISYIDGGKPNSM